MTARTRLALAAAAALLAVASGCASRPLPVQMRGIHLRSVQPDFATRSVAMDFEVRFRLNNPSSTPLPIPDHSARFELDGTDMGQVELLFPGGTELPGDGSLDLAYRVRVDTGLLAPERLGRDLPYRFAASFEIPLPEDVPDLGDLAPHLTLAFEDTIRVPLLPEAALVGAPSLQLVGGQVQVVERDFDLGILEAQRDLWAEVVYHATIGSDAQKAQARESFKDFVDAVVGTDVQVVTMTPVTGIRVRVPVRVENPNQFEIALPSLAVDFEAGARDVWTLRQTPATGTLGREGTAASGRNVTYESTFHFDGLGDLAIPASQRALGVDASADLGHGSVRVPLRIP
jgi:LEA14-like dessication related protein